jgi:hypothetical protein
MAESLDVWADTRRSTWRARRRVLAARLDAFADVAKPLEPYIAVFVLFAAPAFVMSTTFCQNHSQASVTGRMETASNRAGSADVTYGTCDVWCEFVLAFRSLGTVAVYLVPRRHRAEIIEVCASWPKLPKLCARALCRCFLVDPPPRAPFEHDQDSHEYHELLLLAPQQSDRATGAVRAPVDTVEDTSSLQISHRDLTKVRPLGQGMYGEVWEARLSQRQRSSEPRAVAVKYLYVDHTAHTRLTLQAI